MDERRLSYHLSYLNGPAKMIMSHSSEFDISTILCDIVFSMTSNSDLQCLEEVSIVHLAVAMEEYTVLDLVVCLAVTHFRGSLSVTAIAI